MSASSFKEPLPVAMGRLLILAGIIYLQVDCQREKNQQKEAKRRIAASKRCRKSRH